EPLCASPRVSLGAGDCPPTLVLVGGERRRNVCRAYEPARERDRILDRKASSGADREVRGVRRVAEQDEVPGVPPVVPDEPEVDPRKPLAVPCPRDQALPAELLGEDLLEQTKALLAAEGL